MSLFDLEIKHYLIKGLQFDLGDASRWEFMLPSNDKPLLKVPNIVDKDQEEEEEVNQFETQYFMLDFFSIIIFTTKDPKTIEKHMDLPPSWVQPLQITQKGWSSNFYKKVLKIIQF